MQAAVQNLSAKLVNSYIDPTVKIGLGASISNGVVIGRNTSIGSKAIIKAGVRIGANVHIGNDCIVEEGTIIGNDNSISPNSKIGKGVVTGPWCFIGSGSELGAGVVMGANVNLWGDNKVHSQTFIDDGQFIGQHVELTPSTVYRSARGLTDSIMVLGEKVYSKYAAPMTIPVAVKWACSQGEDNATTFVPIIVPD